MGNLIAQRESYTRAGKTDDIDRTFTHDDLSRLTNTDQYVNGGLNKQNVERFLTYDRNGNLLTLIRYADGVQSSNRQYTYIGNRLDRMEKDKVIAWDEIEVHPGGPAIVVPEKVTEDNGTTALDAEISIDTSAVIRPVDPGIILHSRYAHDRNGNLTYDMELETNFAYNSLNLLEKAVRNDTIVAKYSYLADGTKLSAVNADDCGFAYRGSFTYRADAGGDRVFESTPFGGGRIVGTVDDETEVRYFLTDHLESVRVVATDQNNVLERNDYYPFGGRWDSASLPISDNRDRFNGKEDQAFAGLPFSDYGARMYDRERGRWLSQDPLAEEYRSISQYVFCANNPIKYIDLKGKSIYQVTKNGYFILLEYIKEPMDTIVSVKTEDNTSVQSISVSSEILESHQYLTDVESIYPQIKINIASKYETTDVTELKKLFDFVAQNTDVEWAFSSIILNDGTKQYLLTTSHLKNKERSTSMWINEKQPQKWLEHIHNHPMGMDLHL